jgi:uncharacterized protein with ParB-like and HNH nuclease domain
VSLKKPDAISDTSLLTIPSNSWWESSRNKAERTRGIYIPPYQRELRWPERSRSYFIESVLLRIPVPPIFFYEFKGQLEVVDGSQRIRTLYQFVNNRFVLDELEKLDSLNGMRFSDLPSTIQKRFLNTSIRSFVLDEGTDTSTRVEMFRRLSTRSPLLGRGPPLH